MSTCPARALPPVPPFLLPCPLTWSVPNCCPDDESFQFTGFKTNEAVMVSWGGLPVGFQEKEWGVLYVCCLALVAVLLVSEPLPCLPGHSPPCLPFPSTPSPVLHGNCTGLSVCACMCAPVYTCIERYICRGWGREWSTAQGLQPGHCPVEPVICPSVLVR